MIFTIQERLVFARSYGYADYRTNEKASPTSRFRIASISKSITAAAIFKLIENGHTNLLDAKVFGPGALLGTKYGSKPYSANLLAITVRHFLEHTAGGWGYDLNNIGVAFQHYDYSQDQLLSWIVDNVTLTNSPGTVFEYSNVGYMLLGRVIERLSGRNYSDFIQENIFLPAGIQGASLGQPYTLPKSPNEVCLFLETLLRYCMHSALTTCPIRVFDFDT